MVEELLSASGATASADLRFIPLLPFAAAMVHIVFLVWVRRALTPSVVALISCIAPLAAFLLCGRLFFSLVSLPPDQRVFLDEVYLWVGAGSFNAGLTFLYDPLAALLCLVLTGVGTLIHVAAAGDLLGNPRGDESGQRLFCLLNVSLAFALVLVLGENLLVMILGWGGLSLATALLAGFGFGDEDAAAGFDRAFVVQRIGDVALCCAALLLIQATVEAGVVSKSLPGLRTEAELLLAQTLPTPEAFSDSAWPVAVAAGFALVVAALARMSQLPFSLWLPESDSAPAPAAAWIHAAALGCAGVYVLCRLSFVLAGAPAAGTALAWMGAATALLAALAAFCQNDLRRALSFVTLSQLGLVALAAGNGAYTAALYHLCTHAFACALLFLAAGAVTRALRGERDLRNMGGLAKRLPITHAAFLVAALALAGVPPLSGFFSKNEALLSTWIAPQLAGGAAVYWVALVSVVALAAALFRLHALVFWGSKTRSRDVEAGLRDPGALLRYPFAALAALAILGGVIGLPQVFGDLIAIPDSNSLGNFLRGVVPGAHPERSAPLEGAVVTATFGAIALGLLLGYWFYVRSPGLRARIGAHMRDTAEALRNGLYVNDVLAAWVAAPLLRFADRVLARRVESQVIDRFVVEGSARAVRGSAENALKHLQSGFVQTYLFVTVLGVAAMVAWLVTRG